MSYGNRESKEKPTRSRLKRLFSFKDDHGDWRIGKLITAGVLIAIVLCTFFITMLYSAPVGYQSILIDPSGTKSYGASNGAWGLKMPWQGLVIIHYSMQTVGFWGDGTDATADMPAIHTHSSDLLEFDVHALFRWSYNPKALIQLYENYQDMSIVKNQVVASIVRTTIENHLPDWNALDIVTSRPQIALELGEIIKTKIMNTPSISYAIVPESIEFNLRDVSAPTSWYDAIERKLNSEQDIVTAMNNKQISIINSEALAEQEIIEAMGEANATIIRFQGVADAIDTLATRTGANASELAVLQTYLQGLQAIANSDGNSYFFIGFDKDVPFIIPIESQP